jgi:hypothetical protein
MLRNDLPAESYSNGGLMKPRAFLTCFVVLPVLLAGMSGSAAQTAPASANAQIRGSVAGEDGKAIASAWVNAQIWPAAAAGQSSYAPGPGQLPDLPKSPVSVQTPSLGVSPYSAWAQSGPDGSFSIPNLPAGSYRVCAQGSSSELIEPCAWEAAPKTLPVAAGQAVAAPAIVLYKGYRLQLHIDDPGGLLAKYEGATAAARLFTGVYTPAGLFFPATAAAKTLNAQDHSVLVPYGTPVRIGISSGFFSVGDETGKPLAQMPGAGPVIQVAKGSVAAPVRFTITGLISGTGN